MKTTNKTERSEAALSMPAPVPVAVKMVKRMVEKTRMVEETVEDDFGFPVTKMREETYEVVEEVAVEGMVGSTEEAAAVDQAGLAVQSNGTSSAEQLDDQGEEAVDASNAPASELSVSAPASITEASSSSGAAPAFVKDADEAEGGAKDDAVESDESDKSDESDDEESDDDEPKRDKAAGFRAMLEKEQRDIQRRKKAKRKVAGIFEEEASEEEDDAQEGLGEYGDQVSLPYPPCPQPFV